MLCLAWPCAPVWNSEQNKLAQASTDLQIQSSVLRIEFDHNLHSRVFAHRGLQDRTYRIVDYVNNRELGKVHGPKANFPLSSTNICCSRLDPNDAAERGAASPQTQAGGCRACIYELDRANQIGTFS